MSKNIRTRDFIPDVQDAAKALLENGFEKEAKELEDCLAGAVTTSSEFCGQIGLVIQRIRARLSFRLPKDAAVAFDNCIKEIKKVWPRI